MRLNLSGKIICHRLPFATQRTPPLKSVIQTIFPSLSCWACRSTKNPWFSQIPHLCHAEPVEAPKIRDSDNFSISVMLSLSKHPKIRDSDKFPICVMLSLSKHPKIRDSDKFPLCVMLSLSKHQKSVIQTNFLPVSCWACRSKPHPKNPSSDNQHNKSIHPLSRIAATCL